jgi:hypothetical protein
MSENPRANWQHMAVSSPYQTAVAVGDALKQGDVSGASVGIQELIESLSRSDKRALRSHLVRLMVHILKWRTQPHQRSRSWRASIRNARREIVEIQNETPTLNRAIIESMWAGCLSAALDDAEAECEQAISNASLSWHDVFEAEYDLH